MQKRLRGHYRIIEIVPLAAQSHSDTIASDPRADPRVVLMAAQHRYVLD